MDNIKTFYDRFAEKQVAAGINRRHRTIDRWLTRFGLESHHDLLEIGCGIGTQTELLCKRITTGKITACDISPESIRIAKNRLDSYKNLDLRVSDVTRDDIRGSFDFILLPDVLEHIPIERHPQLFKKLHAALREQGKIVIHIPDPYYLAWLKEDASKAANLQIIDQSIYTDELVKSVYPAGLHIEYLESYSMHVEENDYQVIVLRKTRKKTYPPVHRPGWRSRMRHALGF